MERKFLVIFNKTFDKGKKSITGIRIEVQDKASGQTVCPELQIAKADCSDQEFEKLIKQARFDSKKKSYVIEMGWEDLRLRLSGLNRPALDNCFTAAEKWMTEIGKEA
jgi:hypothetical protein